MLISNISFPFCEKKEEKKKNLIPTLIYFFILVIYIYLLEAQTPASILWGTC